MIIDLAEEQGPAEIQADVCIAGAGAAGISLALALEGGPRRVVVLEGGGHELEEASQDLYRGQILGHRYSPLEEMRLRLLGGTTNHWGGTCRPLDASDFERRDWIPHSGWPITAADLLPFRERAHEILDLGAADYDPARIRPAEGELAALDPERMVHHLFRFSEPTRLGLKYGPLLERSANVEVHLHANLVDIVQSEDRRHTTAFEVVSEAGRRLTVRARHFVLALGGIENARTLLAADRQMPTGLGNGHDLVGRFFMEHPTVFGGQLIRTDPEALRQPYRTFPWGDGELRPVVGLSEALRRKERVLNPVVVLRRSEPHGSSPGYAALLAFWQALGEGEVGTLGDHLGRVVRDLDGASADLYARLRGRMEFAIEVFVQAEQSPNPDSRVVLLDERDRLGIRRVGLDWRIQPIDLRSIRFLVESLALEMGRLGLGRVQPAKWLYRDYQDLEREPLAPAAHHMGTTRMADDPRNGVVDRNCRVHGIDNLYLAGSSVFTTGGFANPTLTIVELALRLADHLASR